MKKFYLFGLLAMVMTIFAACSGSDKLDIKVDKAEITGENAGLISVVPGTYTLIKTKDGVTIKIKLKLESPLPGGDSLEAYKAKSGGIELGMGPKLRLLDANGTTLDGELELGESSLDQDAQGAFEKFLVSAAGTEQEFTFSLTTSGDVLKDLMSKSAGLKITGMDAKMNTGYEASSTDESSTDESSSDASASDGEISSSDADSFLDEYDNYVTQYISLLKKASAGDVSAASEYANMLQSAQDMQEKLDAAKGDLTSEQVARLMKIEAKLLKAASMQ